MKLQPAMSSRMMRRGAARCTLGALIVIAAATVASSAARAQSCQELWAERNGYYKDAGYCFKTGRAIAYFGNAGCRYDVEAAVPLPRYVRSRIDEIRWLERNRGCN